MELMNAARQHHDHAFKHGDRYVSNFDCLVWRHPLTYLIMPLRSDRVCIKP